VSGGDFRENLRQPTQLTLSGTMHCSELKAAFRGEMKMNRRCTLIVAVLGILTSGLWCLAQEPTPPVTPPATNQPVVDPPVADSPVAGPTATEQVEDIARQVDQSVQAQEISAGILTPIYKVAEQLSFPMFHWLAFTLMTTGVVSYALQLVLAKLVVLMRMSISISEILSDALGLLISIIGLVLTTQAAAENSSFTRSPAAVLSATAVGVFAGFIFYVWAQRQEVQAAQARAAIAQLPVVKK
jgi:hypothetical protein